MYDDDLSEVIGEFLVESQENLDQLDSAFVELERAPQSREILASIFRTIHTIKGTSGFLGFNRLEAVTHQGENLLARLRDGQLTLTPPMTSALLSMVDAVRAMLQEIEHTGRDGAEHYSELTDRLAALAAGEPGVQPGAHDAIQRAPQPADTQAVARDEPTMARAAVDTTIRVDVALLDRLMNLVGELVLTRNQMLSHIGALAPDDALSSSSQRLNALTSELQEGVMKTRMQPIGTVWSKFGRVVRDLAVMCAKQVRVEMEGKETELDKTIIEAIKDPLTHLVRNSVDHGIESPEVRQARGKNVEGLLVLRAYHEGGQVIIEIIDDGGGIDTDKVRAKAIEKGLLTADDAARLGENELAALIFQPGFSTADKVTNVSGRGVGMDVVKTNIEKIGGSLDVHSRLGEGTTLRIKIPLTLAIVPAIVVKAAGGSYAIPQLSLLELVRLEADQRHQIETVGGAKLFRLRGSLIPVADLGEILGVAPALPADAGEPDALNIVVLHADGATFGLVVDSICDTEEIVVKPLGAHLQALPTYAGTTIMGDGSVALILDVVGIAQSHRLAAERRGTLAKTSAQLERRSSGTTVVVCAVGETRVAVPLALVERLEEFASSAIEYAAGHEVVQYRDGLLPLVRVNRYVGTGETLATEPLQVLVYRDGRRPIGLVVDSIIDIVDQGLDAPDLDGRVDHDEAVQYSGVIGRRVTDILNVEALIERDLPAAFDHIGQSARS